MQSCIQLGDGAGLNEKERGRGGRSRKGGLEDNMREMKKSGTHACACDALKKEEEEVKEEEEGEE